MANLPNLLICEYVQPYLYYPGLFDDFKFKGRMMKLKQILIISCLFLTSQGWSDVEYVCNTQHAISLFESGQTYNELDPHFSTFFKLRIDTKEKTLTLDGSHFGDGYEMALDISPNGILMYGQSNSAVFLIDNSDPTRMEYRYSTVAAYVSGSRGTCIQ